MFLVLLATSVEHARVRLPSGRCNSSEDMMYSANHVSVSSLLNARRPLQIDSLYRFLPSLVVMSSLDRCGTTTDKGEASATGRFHQRRSLTTRHDVFAVANGDAEDCA